MSLWGQALPLTSNLSNSKLVRLKYFPMMHEMHARSYRISAGAELTNTDLRIRYKLEAAAPKEFLKINLPAASVKPSRTPELWKQTCFECFIPSAHSNAYLEFNGSPNGNWNWYSFSNYREGMNEFEVTPESQPRQTFLTQSEHELECEWSLPLVGMRFGFISAGENKFEIHSVGLTAVLSTAIANTYWALSHDGIKPDFHVRSSFNFGV